MNHYDAIVIGAGHNGMVCAAMLAKAGKKVLLIEAGQKPGGLAAAHEFCEGFSAPVAQHATHFSRVVAKELALEQHGLRFSTSSSRLVGLAPDGQHVTVDGDQVSGTSEKDSNRFPEFQARMQRYADALAPFWHKTMPRIAPGGLKDMLTFGKLGWNIRRLGREDMGELLRVFSLPMRDLVDEQFESEPLKALLAWDGLAGSRMAPRSPNNAMTAFLYRMDGSEVESVGNLMASLEKAITASGVELILDAHVAEIEINESEDGLKATGVSLADGRNFSAELVISSADPKTTFLDLVGAAKLEIGFTNRINRLRSNGLVAKLHLALSDKPSFRGFDGNHDRMFIAPSLDAIEFAFDDSKYGQFSEKPVMELAIPSLRDASLAPEGQHVLSANVMYVPGKLKGGWNDEARSALTEAIIGTLEDYEPRIRELVLGTELLTPRDLEEQFGVTGGHWHHGELALDQMLMMRPTYQAAQYATPIPGLYLCGAGTHPAGDLTGAAGYNAAREVLK